MERPAPADPRSAEDDPMRVRLSRDNAFLMHRVAQLQGEVWDLTGRLAHALQPAHEVTGGLEAGRR